MIVGEVPLVPPQINEDFETILGWADEVRRLQVWTNADKPEEAAQARGYGAGLLNMRSDDGDESWLEWPRVSMVRSITVWLSLAPWKARW